MSFYPEEQYSDDMSQLNAAASMMQAQDQFPYGPPQFAMSMGQQSAPPFGGQFTPPPWMMGGGQQGMSPYGPPPWAQAPWMQQSSFAPGMQGYQPQQAAPSQVPPQTTALAPTQPQGPTLQTMQQTQATMPQRAPLGQIQQNMMALKKHSPFMRPDAFRNQMGALFNQRQTAKFGG